MALNLDGTKSVWKLVLVITAGRGRLLCFIRFLIGAVQSCLIGTLSLEVGFFSWCGCFSGSVHDG